MLRFLPEGWLDGILRPFLLADSMAGLYVEIHAPDWRFAALALLLALAWLGHRGKPILQHQQGAALLGLTVCFYVWTAVSGNGRYFMWGLLLVGPLVVVAARGLRATRAMRNTVILGVLAVQGVAVSLTYMNNIWSVRPWRDGPGFALEHSPISDSPAVFVTLGSISYSVLVPQMHPGSRWSNIAGQRNIQPGVLEYPALQALLDSPLPKYAVVRATLLTIGPDRQPLPNVMLSLRGSLARNALVMDAPGCELVRSAESARDFREGRLKAIDEGFWFCPVRRQAGPPPVEQAVEVAPEIEAVFSQVERRCPRFFPPGSARSRLIDGAVLRYYTYSDTGLYVDNSGEVYFKNNRALNATPVGTVDQVRRGAFTLDCHHLPGRYQPPWNRD